MGLKNGEISTRLLYKINKTCKITPFNVSFLPLFKLDSNGYNYYAEARYFKDFLNNKEN